MDKVIVERARGGWNKSSLKYGARLRYVPDHDYEEQPKRAKTPRLWSYPGGGKWFSDVLGPLERFLRRRLGRPWNEVYSEIRASVDERTVTGNHLLLHLGHMVERNCRLTADGRIMFDRWRRPEFYVHPRSGLLCEFRRPSQREQRRQRLLAEPVTLLVVDDNYGYRKHEGNWYRVKVRKVYNSMNLMRAYDIFLNKEVYLPYGESWLAIKKKSCNRKELAEVKKLLARREDRIKKPGRD